jgi:hypothetical protein
VVYDGTVVEKRHERESTENGAFVDLQTRNRIRGQLRFRNGTPTSPFLVGC